MNGIYEMLDRSDYPRVAGEAFAELVALVRTLRDPGGCPWDADQSHKSLRPYLLEETYELLEAIDSEDADAVEEEMGDILTQIAFHADIGERAGTFDAASVSRRVVDKLRQRHPHVFGDGEKMAAAEEVAGRWEELKRAESGRTSAIASLPSAMPALAYAASVQRRAVKAGLPWPGDDDGPAAFERNEHESDEDAEARAGSLLMKLAREVRDAGVDPETALRSAAVALRDRVLRTEQLAAVRVLSDLEEDERVRLWEKADNSN